MFKAISRWGSQVRSSLPVGFITNLFSSKSRNKYGEINEETEEIFSDAHEEFTDDEDADERGPHIDTTPANVSHKQSATTQADDTLISVPTSPRSVIVKLDKETVRVLQADIVNTDNGISDGSDIQGNATANRLAVTASVDAREQSTNNDEDVSGSSDSVDARDGMHEHADDDQHVQHADTTQIVNSASKQNGIAKSSSSSSVFQKVHRRMNSYQQRQYAKFDNGQDDENDNVITADVADGNTIVIDSSDVEQIQVLNDKKTKKKKKFVKRSRRAVRVTWKWLRKSLVQYSQAFSVPNFYSVARAASKQ